MLKDAEGRASPVTGKGGHARGLHAMSPGHLDEAAQLDRVTKRGNETKKQFKKRGGVGTTGAFKTLLQQGSAACEALNSDAGQAALAVFDNPAHAGKKLRINMEISGIKEAGFLPGTLAPHSTKVKQGDASVSTMATTGVMIVIDRGANGATLQIQTCYPLSGGTATSWKVQEMPSQTVIASG
ncbi:MAG TPA: hypothetical protein VKB34_05545 [Povalibacter sp.]|nr:hypothetical protein [Povalibacter sp.]